MLGQAGNRTDADIRMLATVSIDFAPAYIVIKETEGLLRGRALGERGSILREEVLARGMAAAAIARGNAETRARRAGVCTDGRCISGRTQLPGSGMVFGAGVVATGIGTAKLLKKGGN